MRLIFFSDRDSLLATHYNPFRLGLECPHVSFLCPPTPGSEVAHENQMRGSMVEARRKLPGHRGGRWYASSLQFCSVWKSPGSLESSKRETPRHIIIRMTKANDRNNTEGNKIKKEPSIQRRTRKSPSRDMRVYETEENGGYSTRKPSVE